MDLDENKIIFLTEVFNSIIIHTQNAEYTIKYYKMLIIL